MEDKQIITPSSWKKDFLRILASVLDYIKESVQLVSNPKSQSEKLLSPKPIVSDKKKNVVLIKTLPEQPEASMEKIGIKIYKEAPTKLKAVKEKPRIVFTKDLYEKIVTYSILSLIIIIIGAGIFLSNRKTPLNKKAAPELSQASITPAALTDGNMQNVETFEDGTWKTYRDEEFGFEIKYPAEFYIRKSDNEINLLLKISDSRSFEDEEKALIITINYQVEDNFTETTDPGLIEILNNLGFASLKQKFGEVTKGDIYSENAYDYYKIFIPSKSFRELNTGFEISTRIHNSDKTENAGNNSDFELAKQILESFTFFERDLTSNHEVSYKNKKYGYQFTYLKNNDIRQYSCDANQNIPGEEKFVLIHTLPWTDQSLACTFSEWYKPIEIFVNKGDSSTRSILDKELTKDGWEHDINSLKLDKKSGYRVDLIYTGIQEEISYPNYSEVRVLNNGYTYFLILADREDKVTNNIFNQILSTFQFPE